ncbi:MAG TPA: hypothetical protein VK629_05205 [Steroidobacteraceae bacterium]|nr:hypothetical protein [Steroidobacteraceae bacterium]
MLTRREAIVLIGALPAGAALASEFKSYSVAAVTDTFTADRELTLTLSDNLQTQNWIYEGQRYSEERPSIVVHEGECVRVTLVNDTSVAQVLTLDQDRIALAAHSHVIVDLSFDSLRSRTLRNANTAAIRVIEVRPSYQLHALVG